MFNLNIKPARQVRERMIENRKQFIMKKYAYIISEIEDKISIESSKGRDSFSFELHENIIGDIALLYDSYGYYTEVKSNEILINWE